MNRDVALSVLYDMALVVGGEVRLRPLLTRTLQRLLHHTSFPVGLFFGAAAPAASHALEARLEVAIGDYELAAAAGTTLGLPTELLGGGAALREDPALLAALPCARTRYRWFLRLPVDGQGVILLLCTREPRSQLPLAQVFLPVMSNLARAIVLCRHHEEALRESGDTMHAVAQAALDAIVMCDADGNISYWNPAAERMFGYPAAEVLGRDLHQILVPPRYYAAFVEGFRGFREAGGGQWVGKVVESQAVRRSGEEFPVEISVSPVMLQGRWTAVGILRDASERRRIEEQLRQAQKIESVARLAGGVAHDFNNVLTVILGGVDVLLSRTAPDDPLHEEAQEIEVAARRAASLTRQLLIFSRKEVVQPAVVDLDEIVAGMAKMLKRLIGEDVELDVRPSPGRRPLVKADPGQLEQVIVNLAVNARDAMPKGGRLTIETGPLELSAEDAALHPGASAGEHVRLAVRDTGCGMADEVKAHLFEPFFTTKERGKGTGLGLSTVYGIVKQAGGHVRVESAVGEGTTFEILVPRTEEAPEPARARAAAPAPAVERGETILVAEDDDLVRHLVAGVLRGAGYRVLEAADGERALALACGDEGGRVAALVTDVVMPRLGGEELAARIRAARPGLRVLFTSGYTEHGNAADALGSCAAFLQKPFTSAALTHAVRDLLDRAPA